MTIAETTEQIQLTQEALNKLSDKIGKIIIASKKQLPLGWRGAAKGRTVWRIIEEIVIQNLQINSIEYGISNVEFAKSEIAVYDFKFQINNKTIYVNIKTAVLGGVANTDDISKSGGLKTFFTEDVNRQLFIATFFIKFNEETEISVEIDNVVIFPIVWIPSVYINPSNNGNLQSSRYKSLANATKRTNEEFISLLNEEMENVKVKQQAKNAKKNS